MKKNANGSASLETLDVEWNQGSTLLYFEDQIIIPRDEATTNGEEGARDAYSFSWRRLWAFTGPGFLVSIAYLDPGNIQSDLEQGAIARYQLLWVLLISTCIGLLMQVLASRLGTVTGMHLAEICHAKYPRIPRLILWVMVEIAIITADMQEVIGTAISFYLLSNGHIPLYGGVLITICDTFVFLLLDRYGLRKLEAFFCTLITTMAITFGYQYIIVGPDHKDILQHMFVPNFDIHNRAVIMQAVGIIGAVIMPHNFYLHSALVKSRKIDRKNNRSIKEANFYYLIESGIALSVSFTINVLVVTVFAKAFYGKTYNDIHENCLRHQNPHAHLFNRTGPAGNETIEANLFHGGIFLGCQYGPAAMYIWALGLLAAGQSSTMTGTYAGQFAMEGFLNMSWDRWKRILFTRSIAIIPTLALTFSRGVERLNGFNDILNVLQSVQLPFAIFPLLMFTNDATIMKQYKNNKLIKFVTWILSGLIIIINIYFTQDTISGVENRLLFIPIGILCVVWMGCYFMMVYYAAGFTFIENFLFRAKQRNVNAK